MNEYEEMLAQSRVEDYYAENYGPYCARPGCKHYRARMSAYCWAHAKDIDEGLDRYWEDEEGR